MITRIYNNEIKNTEIIPDIFYISQKTENMFTKLMDKLALMHKLLLEEEGPCAWRNQLHLPCLKPQNSSSVLLAASILELPEFIIDRVKTRVNSFT